MSTANCIKCRREFDESTECIPKCLPCGHSDLCSNCLGFYSICPDRNCLEKVPADISNLPTNLKLLSLTKKFNNLSDLVLTVSVKGITKDLYDVLKILEPIQEKVDALDLGVDNNISGQIMIEPLRALDSIKRSLQAIERSFHFGRNTDGIIDIKHHFNNRELLLSHLINKLAAGEKIYAAGMVNEQMKFGKVYLKINGLFINSLSITKRDDISSYFWICDFRSLFDDICYSFFVVPCFEVTSDWKFFTMIFEILENNRKSGFLELCTGEAGAAFKDSSCNLDEETFEINLKASDMKINCGPECVEMISKKNVVIRYISGSNWEIKRVKNNNYPSRLVVEGVIARLIDDIEFSLLSSSEPGHRIILESGVAVLNELITNSKDIKSNQIQKDSPESNQIQKDSPESNQIQKDSPKSNQIQKYSPKSNQIQKDSPKSNQIKKDSPKSNQIKKDSSKSNQIKKNSPIVIKLKKIRQIQKDSPKNQIRKDSPESNQIKKDSSKSNQIKKDSPKSNQIKKDSSRSTQIKKKIAKRNRTKKKFH